MTIYTCYRCKYQPCDICINDGKDTCMTLTGIIDRVRCPVNFRRIGTEEPQRRWKINA